MRKSILQIACVLTLAAFLLAGCSSSGSSETAEPLLETEQKVLSGAMESLMKDGSEADHYSAETTMNGGGELSFVTTKPLSDGRVTILGSVFYGPESDLLDLDEEAYYTDEDWEKLAEDPDYQPVVSLPSYSEILLDGIDSAARSEQSIAGLTLTCGSKTWTDESENQTYYEYRACGADGENILSVTVSAVATDCTDADAALTQADELVHSWIASLQLSDAAAD